jgi:hypothetical protein
MQSIGAASQTNVAQSVQAVNEVMKNAARESTEMAKDQIRVGWEMQLGKEAGKGARIDTSA